MRGRTLAVVAVVMAYAVLLILVSPVVPSPLTTVPSKHTVHPPQVTVALVALLVSIVGVEVSFSHQAALAPPARLGCSGADVVDLTTARLC